MQIIVSLSPIEARTCIRILEWANTQPRLQELSEGEINYIALSKTVISKVEEAELRGPLNAN